MKKTLPFLLIILVFLASCAVDPYETTVKKEEEKQDNTSALAIEYIKKIDTPKLIKTALTVASGTKVDGTNVSNITITDNSIIMSVELGTAETTSKTSKDISNKYSEPAIEGIINLKLLGDKISIEKDNIFRVDSYTISSNTPLIISDDKNGNASLSLNGEFGGDAFVKIILGAENTIGTIYENVIAIPLLPIENASILLNDKEIDLANLNLDEEITNIRTSIEAEKKALENEAMSLLAKELLNLFRLFAILCG